MKMNYERDIEIDGSALDVEWLEQPMLMMRYSKIFADTRQELDLAKEKLDFVYAELNREIRSDPKRFGLNKISESEVQSTIITKAKYAKANKQVINAKYEVDIAKAALQAIEQKKNALENLVRLHGLQYFAGPKVPRDLQTEQQRKETQKKVDFGIAKAMKRNNEKNTKTNEMERSNEETRKEK